ncbi:toll-like receptor 3 [Saccostrea echinata]|uniref:toll-like receptor 3 n=1 Tax=Saccostrea echinata TaxID=191078 RepID=UPI002A832D20|nr:toll-like receptor 3 [Saccostrea echinata]
MNFELTLIFGQILFVIGHPCPLPCSCKKTHVDCHGKKLQGIPHNIPMSSERLILSQNHVEKISQKHFSVLPNLVELQLQNNKIRSIPANTFSGECFPNIQSIRLENNRINSIEPSAFSNLSALVNITLTNNKLIQLHSTAFQGTSLTFLHLGSNELIEIPNLQIDSLQVLILEGNNIQNCIFPNVFETMFNLTRIGLSNNKIQHLERNGFASLKYCNVRKLELARNNITRISNESFLPLSTLQSLRLGWNPLTDVELSNALSSLHNAPLVSLSIPEIHLNGHMPFSSLQILETLNVSTLDMSFNEINNVPILAFQALTQLRTLDISNCGIRYIHENAFSGLQNLNNLLLNNNYVQRVPQNLPKNLLYLYMTGNQIDVLKSNSFSNLGRLRRLHLGNNKILTLYGGAFSGLRNLEELQLYGNRINTLPKRLFAPFTRLTKLELQQNNLKMIQNSTETFSTMTSLKNLNLADNGCSSLPLTLFSNVNKSLQKLEFKGNQLGKILLGDIDNKLFRGLKQLNFLDLSNNQIHDLPPRVFRDLKNLKTLLLRENWIPGWEKDVFKQCISLHFLDLSNNVIAVLNEEAMEGIRSLKNVNFTNNPFACMCDLLWFRKWINSTSTNVLNVENYQCNSPLEWKGRSLLSFDETQIDCSLVSQSTAIIIALAVCTVTSVNAFIIHCYRYYIMYFWYRMKKHFRKQFLRRHRDYNEIINMTMEIDAFIVYSDTPEDNKWIQENLLPDFDIGTEDDNYHGAYKIYYDERDTLGNDFKLKRFMDIMEKSRKIIIVITKKKKTSQLDDILILETLTLKRNSVKDIIIITVNEISLADVPRLLHSKFIIGDHVEWRGDEIYKKVFKKKMKEKLGKPLEETE